MKNYREDLRRHRQILIELSRNAPVISEFEMKTGRVNVFTFGYI